MADVALAETRIWRPPGLDGAVEIVAAEPANRRFPVRLTASLGICLKRGSAHTVAADGKHVAYPADSICVRPPGCVWACDDTGPAGFISIDIEPSALHPRCR